MILSKPFCSAGAGRPGCARAKRLEGSRWVGLGYEPNGWYWRLEGHYLGQEGRSRESELYVVLALAR